MAKIIHFRNFNGGLMDTLNPKGGVTVAFERDGDTVRYAVAMCNDKDVYCRKMGAKIATGRLAKNRNYVFSVDVPEGSSVYDAIAENLHV